MSTKFVIKNEKGQYYGEVDNGSWTSWLDVDYYKIPLFDTEEDAKDFIDKSTFFFSKEIVFLDEFCCLFAEEDVLFSVCFPDEFEAFFSTEDLIFFLSGEGGFFDMLEV
jgi:hypothetical protein